MYIENNLKSIINILQYHLAKDSDNILLIFDTKDQLEIYRKINKRKHLEKEILKTIGELLYGNSLTGIRFRTYHFINDEDLFSMREALKSE